MGATPTVELAIRAPIAGADSEHRRCWFAKLSQMFTTINRDASGLGPTAN